MLNNRLLKFICCPACKSKLTQIKETLNCKRCKKTFKIRYGIPILIDYTSMTPHLRQQIKYFEKEKISQKNLHTLEPWQESYIQRFLDQSKSKKLIYDCGSGSGYMAIELAKMGYMVLVSDVTFKSILRIKKIAQKLNIDKKMFFFCALAEELPIASDAASELVAHAVLEHISEEEKAISEWKRVVKTDGRLFITVPLRLSYIFPLLWLPNIMHDKKIGHLRRYDKKILKEKFRLPIEKTYYTGHLIKILSIALSMLGLGNTHADYFEKLDAKKSNTAFWANNISVVFKNKGSKQ